MNTKPFDRQLWKQYDGAAKEAAKHFIESCGIGVVADNLREAQGRFDQIYDLSCTMSSGKTVLLECEIRSGWGDSPFPYPTAQIAARKLKAAAAFFMMFNSDCNRLLVIPRRKLHSSPVILKSSRLRKDDPTVNMTLDSSILEFELRNEVWKAVPKCELN